MNERFYISGRPEKLKVHVCEQAEKNLKSDFNILKRKKKYGDANLASYRYNVNDYEKKFSDFGTNVQVTH